MEEIGKWGEGSESMQQRRERYDAHTAGLIDSVRHIAQALTPRVRWLERRQPKAVVQALESLRSDVNVRRLVDVKPPEPVIPGQWSRSLDRAIYKHIMAVLDECGGNKEHAARSLGIGRARLYRYLTKWDCVRVKER